MHFVDGNLYSGWYRRMPGGRVEVFTRTHVRCTFIGELSVEEEARRLLERLVRETDEVPISLEAPEDAQ
ncbi:MAG TPA: hypothetical protein VGM84_13135 [Steroidobacteraceae bacterium]|jgi:hypothetical protein